MQLPIVSIIVPVYNAEKCLSKCIDSILEQSYENLELILVDDGSVDNSLQICVDYARKDERVRYYTKANGGPNSARALGIKKSSGAFLMFADADDEFLTKDTIQANMRYVVEDPDVDIVSFPQYTEGEDGTLIIKDSHKVTKLISDKREAFLNWYNGKLIEGGYYSKIYRRKVFNGWTLVEDIRFAEDNYHIPDLLSNANSILISKEGGYVYKYNSSSLIHSEFTLKKRYDLFRMQVRLYGCLCGFENVVKDKSRMFKNIIENAYYLTDSEYRDISVDMMGGLDRSAVEVCGWRLFHKILWYCTGILGYRKGLRVCLLLRNALL